VAKPPTRRRHAASSGSRSSAGAFEVLYAQAARPRKKDDKIEMRSLLIEAA